MLDFGVFSLFVSFMATVSFFLSVPKSVIIITHLGQFSSFTKLTSWGVLQRCGFSPACLQQRSVLLLMTMPTPSLSLRILNLLVEITINEVLKVLG